MQNQGRNSLGANNTSLFIWCGSLIVSVLYLWWFGLLGRMGEHWVPMSLIALVGLMIAGQFGSGLGLPMLFRDDPDKPPHFFSRSFLSGMGVTLLVIVVWIIIYYCEFIYNYDRVLAYKQQYAKWLDSGSIVPIIGPEGIVLAAYTRVLVPYLIIACAPILVLLALCVALPTPDVTERQLSSGRGRVARKAELRGYATGALAACLIALIMTCVGTLATKDIDSRDTIAFFARNRVLGFDLSQLGLRLSWLTRLLAISNIITQFNQPTEAILEAVFVTWSMFAFVIIFFVTYSGILAFVRVSPGLGICLLFSLVSLLHMQVLMLSRSFQFVVVGTGLLALALVNSKPFKYRFPGMRSYYNKPLDLHVEDKKIEEGYLPPGPGLLNDRQVLARWADRLGPKPKLVLVAVSGGAYRASFWTSVVLDELGHTAALNGFLNHIRLMAGASGGMVGAAYVAALLQDPGDRPHSPPIDATARLEQESGRDSLTPIVQQLIRRDLPLSLWPGRQTYDRGMALEDNWKTLDVPFTALRAGEEAGWRPSLVISPMVVETGRRLLFSNLDLYGLTETQARIRHEVSVEPADREKREEIGGYRRYSRSSVEFFRAFPASYQPSAEEEGFKVKTAVRMNGSFPYISPALSLPVVPMRRVVDAGYYDNYGVNLALAWAYDNREWIRANTSGLALVQIRAYASEAIRKRLWVGSRDAPGGPTSRFFRKLSTGVQALTSPPEGGLSALNWSMSYRNDEQIRAIDNYFNSKWVSDTGEVDHQRRPGKPGWFETFVFENPIPFGMNWFVTRDEIRRMKESISDVSPATGLDQSAFELNGMQKQLLADWWKV